MITFKEYCNGQGRLDERMDTIPEEDMLFEMAAIGDLDGQHSVWIRSRDGGQIPHFHVVDSRTIGKKFNSAIFITDNRYFTHGQAKDVLSEKMRKKLMVFLRQADEDGESNWEYLVKTWNKNNSSTKVPNETKRNMPDYTEIKPYK